MEYNTVVIDTDQRQHLLAEELGRMQSIQTPITDISMEAELDRCKMLLSKADAVILPTPVAKISQNSHLWNKLNQELIKTNLNNGRRIVFGGALDSWQLAQQNEKGADAWYDFMKDDAVRYANAQITAEATVCELLKYSHRLLRDSTIAITGYGKCGKAIADLLKRMGADTLVLARSKKAQKCAQEAGHTVGALPFQSFQRRVDAIINTVPALVVDWKMLRECSKDTIILDIASMPGGVNRSVAQSRGILVVTALGLPGVYMTQSGATVFASMVHRILKENSLYSNRSKEQTWIYRITP